MSKKYAFFFDNLDNFESKPMTGTITPPILSNKVELTQA